MNEINFSIKFGFWLRIMFYNSRKAGVLLCHIYNTSFVKSPESFR